ncbi:MAG: PIG-L family deacetylase [Planctomycetes bacterium]|nr:PIG-L family deacetylase [Planctomycetota bacterium]
MPENARPLPAPPLARPCTAPPYRGRVLVVAPHPDDEAIGPGATLVLHRRLGDPVEALFVTTGEHGDNGGRLPAAEYVALRRGEARAAAGLLGIGRTEFWDFPDGMVVNENDLRAVTERLRGVLERARPDVVYAPHAGEQHSDHHFVSLALRRAVAALPAPRPHVLGYEVWSPLQAAFAVDVAAVYETKLQAIRCYCSQLERNDIVRAVDGLNRYRAVLLPPGGTYAEVFEETA